MQWEGRERSSNVDDRRGRRVSTGAVVGGGAGLIVVLLALVLGVIRGSSWAAAAAASRAYRDPSDPAEERHGRVRQGHLQGHRGRLGRAVPA